MKEAELKDILFRFIKDNYKREEYHSTRIEAWQKVGLPDWNLCIGGADLWLENKIAANKVTFQDVQVSWLYQHSRAGGLSYIVVADPTQKVIRTFRGSQSREVAKDGARETEPFLQMQLYPDRIELQYWLDVITMGATL